MLAHCPRTRVPAAQKGAKKVAHARLPSVGFRSWSRFFAVSLQVTWVINPTAGCHYFPPSLQLPLQPSIGLLQILLLGEQGYHGCEQFAWDCYPTASRLRFDPGPPAPESSTLTTRLLRRGRCKVKYCDEHSSLSVCLSVCPSARTSGNTRLNVISKHICVTTRQTPTEHKKRHKQDTAHNVKQFYQTALGNCHQNADWCLLNKFIVSFIIIFGTLSFHI